MAVDVIGVGRDGEGTRFDIYIDCDAVGKGSGNIVCSLITAVFTLTLLLARPLVELSVPDIGCLSLEYLTGRYTF